MQGTSRVAGIEGLCKNEKLEGQKDYLLDSLWSPLCGQTIVGAGE